MIDIETAIAALRVDIGDLLRLERDRFELNNSPLPGAMKDERDRYIKNNIDQQRQRIIRVLEEVVAFPPHHVRHEPLLNQFHGACDFHKSIFVMTKFTDPKNPKPADPQLGAVIQAVRDAVQGCGYVARIAKDTEYHGLLWDNVELYLLGCKRGIAILEDKFLPELNPNVAMEWGWMRGMGRHVLYLVEKDFKSQRADWSGLIEKPFEWANPVPGIKAAVEDWLKKAL